MDTFNPNELAFYVRLLGLTNNFDPFNPSMLTCVLVYLTALSETHRLNSFEWKHDCE